MAECDHGLDERWCTICKNGPTRRGPEPVTVVATFPARFPGDCPSCDLPITEGQTIHRLSNDRYVHAGCE